MEYPDFSLRTRIHNHSTPSERVFCRPAALKNLAIHKGLSAFFRLAGQQNPSPIRHPLIMNTGSKTPSKILLKLHVQSEKISRFWSLRRF